MFEPGPVRTVQIQFIFRLVESISLRGIAGPFQFRPVTGVVFVVTTTDKTNRKTGYPKEVNRFPIRAPAQMPDKTLLADVASGFHVGI